ncbi:MAG: dicarboxylate/amino acid:cation symporter [Clostridiales bacterium]|nr:dicarboxylate/amino acid:cation symporter [Candidatus Crickella equi]
MDKVKTFIKINKKTFILLGAVILGGIVGAVWGEGASVLKPFGTLFINMIQTVVVPLVFLTVATSIGSIKTSKKVGKLLAAIIIVLIVMSILAVCIGYVATRVQLVDPTYSHKLIEAYDETVDGSPENISFLESLVNMFSTDDFSKLLSKNNLLALLVMAVLSGISIQKTMPKSQKILEVLESATVVAEKVVELIMYYAPIGLGCYFADFVGEFGTDIANGLLRTIVVYTITALIVFFVLYSAVIFIVSGSGGLKIYWSKIVVPSVTSISTMSSIAAIPSSTKAAVDMGVSKEVANTTIPLGISFHKGGSLLENVFEITFAISLFEKDLSFITIICFALLLTLMIAGIPMGSGGGLTIMMLSMVGCPLSVFPIIQAISQFTDVPQTLLNVTGNNVAAVVVNRIMSGDLRHKRKTMEK